MVPSVGERGWIIGGLGSSPSRLAHRTRTLRPHGLRRRPREQRPIAAHSRAVAAVSRRVAPARRVYDDGAHGGRGHVDSCGTAHVVPNRRPSPLLSPHPPRSSPLTERPLVPGPLLTVFFSHSPILFPRCHTPILPPYHRDRCVVSPSLASSTSSSPRARPWGCSPAGCRSSCRRTIRVRPHCSPDGSGSYDSQ